MEYKAGAKAPSKMSLEKNLSPREEAKKNMLQKPLVDVTVLMAAPTSAVNRPEQRIAEGQPLW